MDRAASQAVRPTEHPASVRWERVRTVAQLHAWELAWRGAPDELATPAQVDLFRPALLADFDVRIVAAFHQQRSVVSAIANRTGAVVSLSNVFAPEQGAATFWAGCIGMILDRFPGQAFVGYETGQGLANSEAWGFMALEPLRVGEIAT